MQNWKSYCVSPKDTSYFEFTGASVKYSTLLLLDFEGEMFKTLPITFPVLVIMSRVIRGHPAALAVNSASVIVPGS